jgi:hypothetical protein
MNDTESAGVTASERYLNELCKRSFLSLWSYPNLFRDQGRRYGKGDGKELCDHLIIFNEHVIIFSDKSCAFPNSGDTNLDWRRWYKRSIQQSAEQIFGAERWLLKHPDRVFIDQSCSRRFPIPIRQDIRFHRVVVALNASARCKQHFGNTGSGSLAVMSDVQGANRPFCIGELDQNRGYVHVLDDVTLDVILREADTITDFTNYLTRKERLFRSGKLIFAAGEEDILAHYLTHTNKQGEHDFVVQKRFDGIVFAEGAWARVANNPQYLAKKEADRSSYAWDELIEKFNHHLLGGTLAEGNDRPLTDHELGLRMLASESRLTRRSLVNALFNLLATTPDGHNKMRMVLSKQAQQRAYILLVAGQDTSHPEYRERRASLLAAYCQVTKVHRPKLLDIVGIATEPIDFDSRSEDLIYLNARGWSFQDQRNAEELQRELGLLTNLSKIAFHDEEYPPEEARRKTMEDERPRKVSNRSKRRKEMRERRREHRGFRSGR